MILYFNFPPSSPVVWSVGSVSSNECLAPFSHPAKSTRAKTRPIIKDWIRCSVRFFLFFLLLFKTLINFFLQLWYFFFDKHHILGEAEGTWKCPPAESNENSKKCGDDFVIHYWQLSHSPVSSTTTPPPSYVESSSLPLHSQLVHSFSLSAFVQWHILLHFLQ